MPPMRPGSVAAAFPASWASIRPRACKCFFVHSLRPPLSAGGGGVGVTGAAGTPAPPPVRASTRVEIANPIAVRMDAIVTPCSRNRIRIRSARVVFLSKTLDMVSRIWRTCDRSCWLRVSMLSWAARADLRLSEFRAQFGPLVQLFQGRSRSSQKPSINCWRETLLLSCTAFSPRIVFRASSSPWSSREGAVGRSVASALFAPRCQQSMRESMCAVGITDDEQPRHHQETLQAQDFTGVRQSAPIAPRLPAIFETGSCGDDRGELSSIRFFQSTNPNPSLGRSLPPRTILFPAHAPTVPRDVHVFDAFNLRRARRARICESLRGWQ